MEIQEITELVKRAKAGDEEAKAQLCHETYDGAYYSVLKVVKNPDDALDLVQEAYLKAFANLHGLEREESFVKWLHVIAMNGARDLLRKKKPALFVQLRVGESYPDPEFENDRPEFQPDESLDTTETRQMMEQVVAGLPEEQRVCVLLYYYEDWTVAEIAALLGVSENTVKSRLNYARKKIRAQVLAQEKEEQEVFLRAAMGCFYPRWGLQWGTTERLAEIGFTAGGMAVGAVRNTMVAFGLPGGIVWGSYRWRERNTAA